MKTERKHRMRPYTVEVYKVQTQSNEFGEGALEVDTSTRKTIFIDDFSRNLKLSPLKLEERLAEARAVRTKADRFAEADAKLFNSQPLGTMEEVMPLKMIKRKYSSCNKKEVMRILKQRYETESGYEYTYSTPEEVCTVLARNILEMNITDFKWFLERFMKIRETPFIVPESLKLMFEQSKITKRKDIDLQGTLFITRKPSIERSGGRVDR